jgi:hypothetical protein
VRDVTVRLEAENKSRRDPFPPSAQGLLFGQPIKRIVDFNGLKTLRVIGQKLIVGKTLGIKRPFPVIVLPPGSPDINFAFIRHAKYLFPVPPSMVTFLLYKSTKILSTGWRRSPIRAPTTRPAPGPRDFSPDNILPWTAYLMYKYHKSRERAKTIARKQQSMGFIYHEIQIQ